MKMTWWGWKSKENCHVLVKLFNGNFHSKTFGCSKIKYVFRDVKWCFNASRGLKGVNYTKENSIRRFQNVNYVTIRSILSFIARSELVTLFPPSMVFYLQPMEKLFSQSHDKISQSPPSFSCYLKLWSRILYLDSSFSRHREWKLPNCMKYQV